MKHVIIAREHVNKSGFKETVYKERRFLLVRIMHPNKFCNGFRVSGDGWGYDPKATEDEARRSAESYLNRYFSICGGCSIIYK